MAVVFVSGPLAGDAVAHLALVHRVIEGAAGVAHAPADTEALICLLTDRVDESLLARLPKLRVVANVAVGTDNIDLAACKARNVVVTNTPDVLTEATADLAFGLLLSAARRIAEGDRFVRGGGLVGFSPTFFIGARVHGARLGIVGLGRIGRAMARRARGFGMRVLYTQHQRVEEPLERALGVTFVAALDELLAHVDFVSIHCPFTPETRHLLSAARLALLPKHAILVNVARGPIVDEAALAEALSNGTLAAAGLDVFEHEPRVHDALKSLPNVVLTPHIGSAEQETREEMAAGAVLNVARVLEGEAPITPVT